MSEPYQSRVFTFINKRTHQLKDACATGLRHLKVAVVWSGQVLFYPIHLAIAAIRQIQPQLPPPRQQPILPQPRADIDIEQALALVETAGYAIEKSPARFSFREASPAIVVTGTDELGALATVDRPVFDLDSNLATDAAATITVSYIADRAVVATKPIIRGLSSLLGDRSLVLVTTTNEILDILTIVQQQDIRRRIGLDLALSWQTWHTNSLVDRQKSRHLNSRSSLSLASSVIPNSEQQQISAAPNLFERLGNWFKRDRQIAPNSTQLLPPTTEPTNWRLLNTNTDLNLPQLPPITETSDLEIDRQQQFGNQAIVRQPNRLQQLWNYFRDYIYIPPSDDVAIVSQPQEFELIPIVEPKLTNPTDRPIKSATTVAHKSTHLTTKKSQSLEHQPDWIDAIAEEIGYDQSLFSRFLGWLDRAILAIENWSIELWHKITNIRRSSN